MRKSITTDENLTLADVDGTIPGRAALISIDLENPDKPGGFSHAVFVEGEYNCVDPFCDARRLWESIKGDWPDNTVTYARNPRAAYIDWVRKMKMMGISGTTPQDYLDC